MSMRVVESNSQGKWRESQQSWDFLHLRKKLARNQHGRDEEDGRPDAGKALYNARGDLVPPASTLEIDI